MAFVSITKLVTVSSGILAVECMKTKYVIQKAVTLASVESATPKNANILQCKSFANLEEAVALNILRVLKVSKYNSYMKTSKVSKQKWIC
jgi:hypothetical protein